MARIRLSFRCPGLELSISARAKTVKFFKVRPAKLFIGGNSGPAKPTIKTRRASPWFKQAILKENDTVENGFLTIFWTRRIRASIWPKNRKLIFWILSGPLTENALETAPKYVASARGRFVWAKIWPVRSTKFLLWKNGPQPKFYRKKGRNLKIDTYPLAKTRKLCFRIKVMMPCRFPQFS